MESNIFVRSMVGERFHNTHVILKSVPIIIMNLNSPQLRIFWFKKPISFQTNNIKYNGKIIAKNYINTSKKNLLVHNERVLVADVTAIHL